MIERLRHILLNFFRLGLIQLFSVVLQFLLIPVVVSRAGLVENGKLLTALSIAGLFSILINYGTSQSAPLAISEAAQDGGTSSNTSLISEVLLIRLFLFLGVAIFFLLFYWSGIDFALFLLGTLPILLAEVLNPYMVCIGADRLRILSILNFFGRLLGLLFVYYGWSDPAFVFLVNAYVGTGLIVIFLFFWIREISQGAILFRGISITAVQKLLRTNFSLVGSNLLVHLQQSLVLYSIGAVASPAVLGIYAIIDKLIWGFRMMLTSFSGAIFSASMRIFQEGYEKWKSFRKMTNLFLFVGLSLLALGLLLGARPLAGFLGSGVDQHALTMAIRLSAVIPLVTGLNLLNVLELILKKEFSTLYRTNFLIFLIVSFLCLSFWGIHWIFGEILFWMPVGLLLLIENVTLVIYAKSRHHTR